MSKWGLLRGAGQGIAQAGTMMAANQYDKMKEERLQKYQQQLQQQQFDRDDKVRGEDRADQQTRDAQQLAFQSGVQVQNQANSDRDFVLRKDQFEQSKPLVDAQLSRINQEIDITKLDLDQKQQLNSLWNQIREADDPETRDSLYEQYRVLTGTDKDDRFSAVTLYGEENDMGVQTRQSGILNSRTGQITPANPGAAQTERPSLEELLGTPPADGQPAGAPGSESNPMSYQQGGGLLRQPSSSELSQELGVNVNPSVMERIGGAIQGVAGGISEFNTAQSVRWVKSQIQQGNIDRPNMANRHAYRSALESGELTDQEATIIRRLLGEQ